MCVSHTAYKCHSSFHSHPFSERALWHRRRPLSGPSRALCTSPRSKDELPCQGEMRSAVLREERRCRPAWDGVVSTSPLPLWLQAGASNEPGWAAFASLESLQRNYKETVVVCSLHSPKALALPVQKALGLLLTLSRGARPLPVLSTAEVLGWESRRTAPRGTGRNSSCRAILYKNAARLWQSSD